MLVTLHNNPKAYKWIFIIPMANERTTLDYQPCKCNFDEHWGLEMIEEVVWLGYEEKQAVDSVVLKITKGNENNDMIVDSCMQF